LPRLKTIEKEITGQLERMDDFDSALGEAVEQALREVLGETGKEAICRHLHSMGGLPESGIPENIEKFHSALNQIFGIGTPVIEKCVLKILCSKLGVTLVDRPQPDFIELLDEVRRSFQDRASGTKP